MDSTTEPPTYPTNMVLQKHGEKGGHYSTIGYLKRHSYILT